MPKLTGNQYLGFAKETAWGTGVVPTVWMPFDKAKGEEVVDSKKDEGKRAVLSKVFNTYPTTKKSSFDIDANFYPNELGFFLLSILGKDTVTGVSPYVHKFQEDAAQKSLTVQHFNGSDERRYAGMIVDEFSVKGDAEGVLTSSVKLQGKFPTVVTASTPTFGAALAPVVGAFCSCTIDAVANTNLFGFEVSIKRNNKLIFGANTTQDPTKAVQGTIEISGKLTFDVEDSAEMAKYEAQTSHVLVLTLGNTANNKAKITMSNVWIDKASFDDGQENLRVDWEFTAMYNTTDAGAVVFELTNTTVSY